MALFQIIFISTYVIVPTTGFFMARWIIKSYALAPLFKHSKLNPFQLKPLTKYEKFKIYFFCVSGIALLKTLLFLALCVGFYLISIIIITLSPSPTSFPYKSTIVLLRYLFRIVLFIFSFYYIKETDSRNINTEQFRVIVSNHHTIFDAFIMFWKTNGVIVAKSELSNAPLIGRILTFCGTLFIDRHGKKGRNSAKQQIIDHINDKTKPQLIIFPQGTTSNIYTITQFKKGAYLSKKKVLNVALNWSENKSNDISFIAMNGLIQLAHIFRVGCCQFVNYCHINIINEHSPNKEEQNNVNIFTQNSRNMIIKSLNKFNKDPEREILGTSHNFSDYLLLRKAYKNNPNFDPSPIMIKAQER